MKPVTFAGYALQWDLAGEVGDTGTRLYVPKGKLDISGDIPLCAGHEQRIEYARTSQNTLSMWEDAFGVAVSFSISNYGVANAITSGATCGLSFLYLLEVTHIEERTCGKVEIVDRAGVQELSVVTDPKMLGAYCWHKDWDCLGDLPPECRAPALAWLEGLKELREKDRPPRRAQRAPAVGGLSAWHKHQLMCAS
jgi:hypothetical protein